MSKRKGKQMSNLPHSYIEAMEGLQMENEQLRKRILALENQYKNKYYDEGFQDGARAAANDIMNPI